MRTYSSKVLAASALACLLATFLTSGQGAKFEGAFPRAKTGETYMHAYYLPPPTSTPWFPAWSPSGEEIAFSMHGSIWKIRAGETVARELTASTTYDSSPAWSPDGKWIVYTAETDSQHINLRILNVATSETRPLTSGDHINLDPLWSRDGTRIAYVSTFPDGWFNIFVMPVSDGMGGKPVQLTVPNDYGKDRLYFGRIDLHIQPTWSPDAKELILVSNRGVPLGSGALWRMPAEPGGIEKARLVRREETLYRTRPDWSPDGSRIVYSSHLGGEFNQLYILPADGGEPYKLTFGDWDHFHPRWSPDGHRIAYISNQRGLTELRILETFGGRETLVDIQQKEFKRPMGRLDVRVLDSATGQPTAARIYARSSDGKAYFPDGVFHRVGKLGEHLFHNPGRFSLQAPVGRVDVEAVKGFEYRPASGQGIIRPGEVTQLDLWLPRIADLAAAGWYGGTTHAHMNYGGNIRNTPETMVEMASAEDVSVVCALVANKDNRVLDYRYFSGDLDPRSTPSRLIYFNQEYRPPFYGHISLLNLKQHLVSPFTTGYEGTALASLYPSNTDILRMARERGAVGGYVHPFRSEPSQAAYANARALPVDVALGLVDYLEVMSVSDHLATTRVWHRILNCGFKLPGIAGEDSINDLHRMPLLGANRTYVRSGPALTWRSWIDTLRKGHAFVTNGPLLEFEVNGVGPGGELRLPPECGRVTLRGSLRSIVPVEHLEVLNNGRVIESIRPAEGEAPTRVVREVDVQRSGWYALRAYSAGPAHPIDDRYPFAETNPVYVYCAAQPIRSAEDARYFVNWIDEISRMATDHSGWRSERERDHVLRQFHKARSIYEQRAREGD